QSTERIESYWHTVTSMDFLITSSDAPSHRIAPYFADYQRQGRSTTIQVLNSATGTVLDSRQLTDYTGGIYLIYNYTGNVTLRGTRAGPPRPSWASTRRRRGTGRASTARTATSSRNTRTTRRPIRSSTRAT